MSTAPEAEFDGFLDFMEVAIATTSRRLPGVDTEAMRLILLLHRVTNVIVYDLESQIHRPAGWSWSAFRLLFAVWVSGPIDAKGAAQLTGMSRSAVSALAQTLAKKGLLSREDHPEDGRAVVLDITDQGRSLFDQTFLAHNAREVEWTSALTPSERRTLTRLLSKLSTEARASWVSHRDPTKQALA